MQFLFLSLCLLGLASLLFLNPTVKHRIAQWLFIVIVVVFGLSLLPHARAGTLGVHVGSQHFPNKPAFTNVNPGIYYKADNGLTTGVFRNSLSRISIYAGYTFEYGPFGLTVGGITGYKYKNGFGSTNAMVAPLVAPSVLLPKLGSVQPRLTWIPPVGNIVPVLHLSLEYSF